MDGKEDVVELLVNLIVFSVIGVEITTCSLKKSIGKNGISEREITCLGITFNKSTQFL